MEYGARSEDCGALVPCCRDFEDLTDVRLLKPTRTDAFAGHARPTLTTQLLAPSPLGMIFAYPPDSEAGGAIRIDLSEAL
jgi:hypothetical protein